MIDATEVQESAESCIAALLVIDNNDLISEFINVLGTDPRIMPNAHYKAVFQAILPKTALVRKAQVFRLGAVGAKPI